MSVPNTEFMNISAAKATLQTHKVGITEANLIAYPDDVDRIEEDLAYAEFLEGFLPPGTDAMQPMSDIFYPILENAYEDIKMMENDGEDYAPNSRNIVGFFTV